LTQLIVLVSTRACYHRDAESTAGAPAGRPSELVKRCQLVIGIRRAYDVRVFSDDAERIDRLERQVQYLLRYMGVDPEIAAAGSAALPAGPPLDAASSPEIVALVQNGKPIQAIKAYRQITGAGLKESKDAIDGLRFELGLSRRRGGDVRRRG